jgi:hypothetical protein
LNFAYKKKVKKHAPQAKKNFDPFLGQKLWVGGSGAGPPPPHTSAGKIFFWVRPEGPKKNFGAKGAENFEKSARF